RVVTVADQDPFVEFLGLPRRHQIARCLRLEQLFESELGLIQKLLEQHPPQALLGPRVAGEERSLDNLRQVPEGEHRAIQIGEIALQEAGLVGSELEPLRGQLTLGNRHRRTSHQGVDGRLTVAGRRHDVTTWTRCRTPSATSTGRPIGGVWWRLARPPRTAPSGTGRRPLSPSPWRSRRTRSSSCSRPSWSPTRL